jgi:hypothetical protein
MERNRYQQLRSWRAVPVAVGMSSLALPAGLVLLALAMSFRPSTMVDSADARRRIFPAGAISTNISLIKNGSGEALGRVAHPEQSRQFDTHCRGIGVTSARSRAATLREHRDHYTFRNA